MTIRVAILAVLLCLPVLVVCMVDPYPNDAETTAQSSGGQVVSTSRILDLMEPPEQDVDTESSEFGQPLEASVVSTTNAEAAAEQGVDFESSYDAHYLLALGYQDDPIVASSVVVYDYDLFVGGDVPEDFIFLYEVEPLEDAAGGVVDVTATLDCTGGGSGATELLPGVRNSVLVGANSFRLCELAIASTLAVPAAVAGTLASVTTHYVLRPTPNVCLVDEDCSGDLVCDAGNCRCLADADCPGEEICRLGFCQINTCTSTGDCSRPATCVGSQCLRPAPGLRCDADYECGDGLRCLGEGYFSFCGECTDTIPCPDGVPCVDHVCADSDDPCASDAECRPGSFCHPSALRCVEGRECLLRGDCGPDEICNRGNCEPSSECFSDGECQPGWRCCEPEGMVDVAQGPAAYCAPSCVQQCTADEECPTGWCDNGYCEFRVCGDELLDAEPCDGANLAGRDCEDFGNVGGTLACLGDCNDFDFGGCIPPVCLDGEAEGGEICDGADLRGEGCRVQGFDGGSLACVASCDAYELAGCTCDGAPCGPGEICVGGGCAPVPVCGDDQVAGLEACDGSNLDGVSCEALPGGFTGGELGCTASCEFDTAGCTCRGETCGSGEVCNVDLGCVPEGCGNGVLDPFEECDTIADCSMAGFSPGLARCTAQCTIDTSGCFCGGQNCGDGEICLAGTCAAETCGDGVTDPGEGCDGDTDGWGCADVAPGAYDGGSLGCTLQCDYDVSACTCDGVACSTGESCVDGACVCIPGTSSCEAGIYRECAEDRRFEDGLACTTTCVVTTGSCQPIPETAGPNDSASEAQDLGALAADSISVVTASLSPGDSDWYSFETTGAVASVVVFAGLLAGTDATLSLCAGSDPDCLAPVASDDDGGAGLLPEIQGVSLVAGTYYVVVEHFDPSAPFDYELTIGLEGAECTPGAERCVDGGVELCTERGEDWEPVATCVQGCLDAVSCQPVAATEPSDDFLNALLALGSSGAERFVFDGDADGMGDLDYYQIVVSEDSYVTVDTSAPVQVFGDDQMLRGQDDDGQTQFFVRGSGGGSSYVVVAPTASYTLTIDAFDIACTPFALRCREGDLQECDETGQAFLDRASCRNGCNAAGDDCQQTSGTEPDGSPGQANDVGTIKSGMRDVYFASNNSPVDTDWYTFVGPDDGVYTIESFPTQANTLNHFLTLYDDGLTPLRADNDGGEDFYSSIQIHLDAGGYFVLADTRPLDQSGAYGLSIEHQDARPDGARAGMISQSPTALESDGATDRRLASFAKSYEFGTGSTFTGSASAATVGGLQASPEASASLTWSYAGSLAEASVTSMSATARDTWRVRSLTDPDATGPADLRATVSYRVELRAPPTGPPTGADQSFQWIVLDATDAPLLSGGARLREAGIERIGSPCPLGDSFQVTDLSTAQELRFELDASCTWELQLPLNAGSQLGVVAAAAFSPQPAAAPPSAQQASVVVIDGVEVFLFSGSPGLVAVEPDGYAH